jgi:hypothetical protein
MSPEDIAIFHQLAGDRQPPGKPVKTLVIIAGRRSGKSFMTALLANYLGLFYDYRKYLSVGERGVIAVTAADKVQARVIFNYAHGILRSSPILAQYVVNSTKDTIELSTHVDIQIRAADYRSIRGPTYVAGLCDEVASWPSDPHSARPDMEFIEAIEPGMLTIPNSMLVLISSPYARRGALWHYYEHFYSQESDECLVIQAPSILLNPTLDRKYIDKKIAASVAARSEYLGTWREDIESFLSYEAIQAVIGGHSELLPEDYTTYRAAVDVSGGRHDAFALSIGHHDGERIVVDKVRFWDPPLNPLEVVGEIVEVCKPYGITSIVGDKYAAEWSSTAFEKAGLHYRAAPLVKSDLYLNLEPVINTQKIVLPNNERLVVELRNLERRRGRTRDIVDHPPQRGATDDVANTTALVAFELKDKAVGEGKVHISLSTTGQMIGAADPAMVRDILGEWGSGGDW